MPPSNHCLPSCIFPRRIESNKRTHRHARPRKTQTQNKKHKTQSQNKTKQHTTNNTKRKTQNAKRKTQNTTHNTQHTTHKGKSGRRTHSSRHKTLRGSWARFGRRWKSEQSKSISTWPVKTSKGVAQGRRGQDTQPHAFKHIHTSIIIHTHIHTCAHAGGAKRRVCTRRRKRKRTAATTAPRSNRRLYYPRKYTQNTQ